MPAICFVSQNFFKATGFKIYNFNKVLPAAVEISIINITEKLIEGVSKR